MQNKAK